jgi:hypothetical protein
MVERMNKRTAGVIWSVDEWVWSPVAGTFKLMVRSSSRDIRLTAEVTR